MQSLKNKTLYELLDVRANASPYEIRCAYQEVHELYSDKALATYSFFTDLERKELLSQLEQAYLVLINIKSRYDYDQQLINLGLMEEAQQYREKSKDPIPLYTMRRDHASGPAHHPAHPVIESAVEIGDPSIQAILQQETLSGRNLKTIRDKIGISLEQISLQSKVKIGTFEAIEEDLFDQLPPIPYLKGFLKSYAQILHLDADQLITGYIRHMQQTEAGSS